MIIKLTNLHNSICLVNSDHILYTTAMVRGQGTKQKLSYIKISMIGNAFVEVLETSTEIYNLIMFGTKKITMPTSSEVTVKDITEPSFSDLVKSL